MVNPGTFTFAVCFLITGILEKYIDCAFDGGTFSKKKALLLAPFLGIFYAFLMSLHQTAATILLALLVGAFISGKINNIAFYLQAIFWGIFIFVFGHVSISIFLFLTLVCSCFIDETGNDLSDKSRISNKYVDFWFRYRLTMDLTALLLVIFGFLELIFFIAFLAFDMGYILVGKYSKRVAQK